MLCHQNRHHSVRETVQSGASGCESDVTRGFHLANDKPRREAGLCGSVRDRAGKRVNGFEPSTFTLATCKNTDLMVSTESISCGDGKGVTNTVTTGVQDAGLVRLLEAWPTLPEDRKQSILELLGK